MQQQQPAGHKRAPAHEQRLQVGSCTRHNNTANNIADTYNQAYSCRTTCLQLLPQHQHKRNQPHMLTSANKQNPTAQHAAQHTPPAECSKVRHQPCSSSKVSCPTTDTELSMDATRLPSVRPLTTWQSRWLQQHADDDGILQEAVLNPPTPSQPAAAQALHICREAGRDGIGSALQLLLLECCHCCGLLLLLLLSVWGVTCPLWRPPCTRPRTPYPCW